MRHKTLPVLAALAALLCLSALAAPASARGPGDILRNPRLLARYLRLTPEQVQQQRQLVQELKAEVGPLRAQGKELRADLRAALEESSPEACGVGALVVEIDGIRDQVREALAEFDTAFTAILTPEQRERYEALKEAARLLRGGGNG